MKKPPTERRQLPKRLVSLALAAALLTVPGMAEEGSVSGSAGTVQNVLYGRTLQINRQEAAAPTVFDGEIDVSESSPVLTDGIEYKLANEATANGKVYIITKSGDYLVTGTAKGNGSNRIAVVGDGVTANVVLDNVEIDVSEQGSKEDCAFFLGAGTKTTVFLKGTNRLASAYKRGGIEVYNSELTIEGDGSLFCSSVQGAGIGGRYNRHSENVSTKITINGGSIDAKSSEGAGIGGGNGDPNGVNGPEIIINGGTVSAFAVQGAGIGGGSATVGGYTDTVSSTAGSGGKITINGGTVNAVSNGGAAIGGGSLQHFRATPTAPEPSKGGDGGDITITGGTVFATSNGNSPAIGGGSGRGDNNDNRVGNGGDGGSISIEGGIVTAKALRQNAIGGGSGNDEGGSAGNISIKGGTVSLSGDTALPAIGPGSGSSSTGGSISITGGSIKTLYGGAFNPRPTDGASELSMYSLTVGGETAVKDSPITGGSVDGTEMSGSSGFGIKDMRTDEDGKLYLYLPKSTAGIPGTVTVSAEGKSYTESWVRDNGGAITLTEAKEEPGGETSEKPGGETSEKPGGETSEKPGGETSEKPGGEAAPVITAQPADASIYIGEKATLSVTAENPSSGTLKYQWYKAAGKSSDGTAIAGATSALLVITESDKPGTMFYYAEVTGSGGKTRSGTAAVTVSEKDRDPKDFPFTDVTDKDWFMSQAVFVWKHKFMNGSSDTEFEPYGMVSRGMVATVLWNMENAPDPESTDAFGDLTEDWYVKAVNWAKETGVASGNGDGSFTPDNAITREELAVMLRNYASWKGSDISKRADLARFTDSGRISGWALEAMRWANAEGIINGHDDGKIGPLDTAIRAELASMIMSSGFGL